MRRRPDPSERGAAPEWDRFDAAEAESKSRRERTLRTMGLGGVRKFYKHLAPSTCGEGAAPAHRTAARPRPILKKLAHTVRCSPRR